MAAPFPRLPYGNDAVKDLKAWLEGQREQGRNDLEHATDMNAVLRIQGRLSLIEELQRSIDPARPPYGVVSLRE